MKEFTIESSGGPVRVIDYDDGLRVFPDHHPHCIIYELGVEHCNCADVGEPDEGFED